MPNALERTRQSLNHDFYITRAKELCIAKFYIDLIKRKIITVNVNVVEQAAQSFWKGPDRFVEAIIDAIVNVDREAVQQERQLLSPFV